MSSLLTVYNQTSIHLEFSSILPGNFKRFQDQLFHWCMIPLIANLHKSIYGKLNYTLYILGKATQLQSWSASDSLLIILFWVNHNNTIRRKNISRREIQKELLFILFKFKLMLITRSGHRINMSASDGIQDPSLTNLDFYTS